MDEPKSQKSLQYLDQTKSSAVSNTGTANNYNIQGNQYFQYGTLLPNIWEPPLMLPPRTQTFVGREEDIAWLLQYLNMGESGMELALCGPGGIGKTALVAEAVKRLIAQKDWRVLFPDGIFYYSFYTYPSLNVAFEELVRAFGGEFSGDSYLAARRAVSHRKSLLIFDGVEVLTETRLLREICGKNVTLLLSHRRSDASDQTHRRDLDVLPQEQAIKLLQKLAGSYAANRQSVEQLVRHISGYPLALQLVGNYLSSRQEEVTDFLHWFEQAGLAAIDYGKQPGQSVSVLLQRTYNSLALNERYAFLLLGMFAPAPFPLELVQNILASPKQTVRQSLGTLVNLSILRHPGLEYEVSHPLIHMFAMGCLSSTPNVVSIPSLTLISSWRDRYLTTLLTHFEQSDPYDSIDISLWYPHIKPLLSTIHLIAQQDLRAANLFDIVGLYANAQGKYAEAEPLLQRALAIREQQLGPEHPDIAQSLNNLALLYHMQGRYVDAEPLYRQALEINEHLLGLVHPNTAQSLSNLARLYDTQGKYAEAEPLLQRALEINEQQLGAMHPNTAQSLSNLARLYDTQGKYAEAESLLQRGLEINEQQLGRMHPNTALSLNNLARFYDTQGRYTEAEPLYRRALEINEQLLGPVHPNTALSLNNLAVLYQAQGKYAEVEPLYQRALKIREQQLGPEHPDTAQSFNNLGALYQAQGRYAEAEPLYQRALEIREQQLGPEHPDTALSLNGLALLYYKQGKYAEAEPLYQRALEIHEQQLRPEHPDTAGNLNNLAVLYQEQGRYAEAEPLLQRALEIREQQLGAMHSDTAQSLNNLAVHYQEQGKYAEAEPLYQRALKIREQQLGPEHPDTALNLNNLGTLYRMQGKYAEAKPLYQRALAIYENTFGLNHPGSQTIRTNYFSVLNIEQQSEME